MSPSIPGRGLDIRISIRGAFVHAEAVRDSSGVTPAVEALEDVRSMQHPRRSSLCIVASFAFAEGKSKSVRGLHDLC